MTVEKALVLCSAGHTVEHLEKTGVTESMRRIILGDRLLGVGVKAAEMQILGGMMPGEDSSRDSSLQRAYELGKAF